MVEQSKHKFTFFESLSIMIRSLDSCMLFCIFLNVFRHIGSVFMQFLSLTICYYFYLLKKDFII